MTVTAADQEGPSPEATAEPQPARRSPWAFLRSPLFLLGLLLVASTVARAAWISTPNFVVVDERYYVSAGRHIAWLPITRDEHYADKPTGTDPNAEHPPLAKVFIAWSMRIFGDRPLGWRVPSVLFGTLAVAAIYWLARSAGAGQWEALGAAALMAADNMFLVYGRYATLDIFVVVFMMVGIGLYLRQRPVLAGIVVGVGACTKLVGLNAIAIVAVIELLRRSQERRGLRDRAGPASYDLGRLAGCILAAAISYLALLGVLDRTVTDFPDPVAHTRLMLTYAESATFQVEAQANGTYEQGQLAPVSRPWEWLLNRKSFDVHRFMAAAPGQPGDDRVLIHFEAKMSPFIIWLAVPAFLLVLYRAWSYGDEPSNLALAWLATTFVLFVALVLRERVSYIYYVVTFLPGVHLALARAFSRRHMPQVAIVVYGCLVAASFVAMFPFRTWAGR